MIGVSSSSEVASLHAAATLACCAGLTVGVLGIAVVASTPMLRGRNFGLLLAVDCATNVLDIAVRLSVRVAVVNWDDGRTLSDRTARALVEAQGYLSFALLIAMQGIVTLLSVDRYVQIVHPLRAAALLGRRRALAGAGLCHALGFAVAALPFVDARRGFGGYSFSEYALTGLPVGGVVYVKAAVMSLFLVAFTAFYCHTCVLRAAVQQARFCPAAAEAEASSAAGRRRGCPRAQARLRRGLAICIVLVAITIVCSVAHIVVTTFGSGDGGGQGHGAKRYVTFVGVWLVVLNNAVTPGLYMLTYRDFARAVRRGLSRVCSATTATFSLGRHCFGARRRTAGYRGGGSRRPQRTAYRVVSSLSTLSSQLQLSTSESDELGRREQSPAAAVAIAAAAAAAIGRANDYASPSCEPNSSCHAGEFHAFVNRPNVGSC